MKKLLLTFSVLLLAFSPSWADVEINETNFPDENLRQRMTDLDSNGDGVLTDDELSQYTTSLSISNVTNLKGLELLSHFTDITLDNSKATDINLAYLPSTLTSLNIEYYPNLVSLDLSNLQHLEYLDIRYSMDKLSSLTLSPNIQSVSIHNCPELKGLDFSQYISLNSIYLGDCNSIQDISLNGMSNLTYFSVDSYYDNNDRWSLNSINVTDCQGLSITVSRVKVNSITISGVQQFSASWGGNINTLTVKDCPAMQSLDLRDTIGTLTLANLPELESMYISGGVAVTINGLEQLTKLTSLQLSGYGGTSIKNLPPNLTVFRLEDCASLSSVDASGLGELRNIAINNCERLASLEMPAVIQTVVLENCPSLTELDLNKYQYLEHVELGMCGMKDISISNKEDLRYFSINRNTGKYDPNSKWSLNTIKVTDCPYAGIDVNIVKAKKMTVSNVGDSGYTYSISGIYSEIDSVCISNCATTSIYFWWDSVPYMELKGMRDLMSLNVSESKVEKLVVEDCPSLWEILGYGNRLSWLDLSSVVYHADWGNGKFQMNDQNVDVQAVKISPTEVGLRVDPRLDVSKVQDLIAKGEAMQAKEIFVDGIRYFVFYNNGPQTESLVGAEGNGYRYNTGWPYPWIANPDNPWDENSKDNLMPVTLHVTSWTKHQAFLKLSVNRVSGVYGEPLEAPVLTRSQDYDGKVTFSSSDESVVKVDAETGALTVVGAGTAIISVSGVETDYRLAPATLTYSVFIDKAQPVIAFPAAKVNTVYGETVSNNPLTVTWYEGTVNYTSADPAKAVVDAEGVVTTKGAGDVVISGIAPETANFYRAQVEYTLHIDKARPVISFPAAELNAVYGDEFAPENKLNVTWYEGQVTYVSDDKTKAEVSAQGKVRILGAGDVTVSGIAPETANFYPAQTNYLLHIAKASPVFNFEKDAISLNLGESVPENALTTGLYDGEVVFSLSNDTVATIDASGILTVIGAGEVVVTATGAATDNCNEPVKAEYKLTVTDPTGISKISADNPDSEAVYDMLGRRVQNPVRQGIYIIGNRKVIVK